MIESHRVVVTGTPVLLASDSGDVVVRASSTVFVGGPDVSALNGLTLSATSARLEVSLRRNDELWAVSNSAADVEVLVIA